MLARFLAGAAIFTALLAAQDPTRELVRKSIQNYERSQRLLGFFLYERRMETRQFNANGDLKEKKLVRIDRCLVEDLPVTRLVERDGKPLPTEEAAKQNAKIRKSIDEFRALDPEEQRKRLESGSPQGREIEFVREMPEALDYRYTASQWEDGREILEFDFEPRTQYKARNTQARVFEKVRGKLWIDKSEAEIRRVDAEVFDNVSVGGFLAHIYKGTRFQSERRRFAAAAWLPMQTKIRFGVRIMAFKNIRQETENLYSGYRVWRPELLAAITAIRE